MRYWLINQAIDAVGGMPAGSRLGRLLYMAMDSDEGCRAALIELSTPPLDIFGAGPVSEVRRSPLVGPAPMDLREAAGSAR